MKIRDWFVPTPANGYKAFLLKPGALAFYTLLIIILNIVGGTFALNRSYALLDVNQFVALHNQERQERGLESLEYNERLSRSAAAKGRAMLESDCWSHYCPNGKSPWDFFETAGYDYIYAGENLAEGFSDGQTAMQAWMNSPTHRENILKSQFSEIGIAIMFGDFQGINDNAIVVVHFGHPRQASSTNDFVSSGNELTSPADLEQQITISYPADGSLINETKPEITGEASTNQELEIDLNNERSGRVIPNGGIFTYRPSTDLPQGENSLVVSVEESQATSNFAVDSIAPSLDDISIEVIGHDQASGQTSLQISTVAEEQITDIVWGDYLAEPNEASSTEQFNLVLPQESITSNLVITLEDAAGNAHKQALGEKLATRLKSEIDSLPEIKASFTSSSSRTPHFSEIVISHFTRFSAAQLASLGIIIFVMVLLIAEILTIARINREQHLQLSTSAPLQLSAFSLLLFIMILGNISGQI